MAEAKGTQVTFLEAIKQAMFEEMERDPAVVLLGEARARLSARRAG